MLTGASDASDHEAHWHYSSTSDTQAANWFRVQFLYTFCIPSLFVYAPMLTDCAAAVETVDYCARTT
eukprot:19882-Heterococcus_DN1.PRE.8